MNYLHVLDCTLRDGGYCNNWKFGFENIEKIVRGLMQANIEIIECGFITNTVSYEREYTKFTSIEQISEVIPKDKQGKLFVAMINYGEYDTDDIPMFEDSLINGIRVAFHKKDLKSAINFCRKIKEKGYKVFVQPMVSLCYSDEEFLEMIKLLNEVEPYALYIVDSFGAMKAKDLQRLFYLVEHNLSEKVWIGFHSHNNMQLAYSNAQSLIGIFTNRNLIVDSSVYGMGRGAGNLNTELFIEYLNEAYDKEYQLKPILNLIDEIIGGFYQQRYWGYSLPNYISASHNAHPNYANYLDEKKTLTVKEMNELFELMDEEHKYSYDKHYIEKLYMRFMETGLVQKEHYEELLRELSGKRIILIAPGKSSEEEKEKIINMSEMSDTIVVSVNFEYRHVDIDYLFISNMRRFKELNYNHKRKCIITSNIPIEHAYYQTEYGDIVNDVEGVRDNAGLMAIKFFMNYNIKEILLAGFDGYSHDVDENYANSQMAYITRSAVLDAMNDGMTRVIRMYSNDIKISFLTEPKHICMD